MYPTEYRWINAPTPVMSSTNVSDSGSSRSPKSTCREPTPNQRKSDSSRVRCSGSSARVSKKISRPTTKAAATVATPSQWPQRSARRPASSSTRAPNAGSANSSQASPAVPVAGRTSGSSVTAWLQGRTRGAPYACPVDRRRREARRRSSGGTSVLEQVGVVDRRGAAGSEDRHDDREPDDDLGRGDDHHEEGHHLAVERAVDPRKGDQGEVDGVEHQLDAHEHDDRVAPHQDADGADGEQHRRQQQVVRRAHRSLPSTASVRPFTWARPVSACASSGAGVGGGATSVRSMISASDSGAIEPSGSRAGTATEFAVANTPGPGSGEMRSCSPRSRASTVARWPGLACARVCAYASTIAASAAVISSAEVSSKANRYLVKISCPMPGTLPFQFAPFAASPAGMTSVNARPTAATSSTASPTPNSSAAARWQRSTSTTESELSRPTSISTNRKSIITAPV